MRVVRGCRFNCDPNAPADACANMCDVRNNDIRPEIQTVPIPVVDLPLGATEDRVVGALDLERALTRGEKGFEPGLLARAHRGFLYIDEVNLLEDHLVDLLLDVATSGENIVEREGLSVRHPAQFVLVGSGNPEEGELRPQLLDRFGLSVDVRTPAKLADRVESCGAATPLNAIPSLSTSTGRPLIRRSPIKSRQAASASAASRSGDSALETMSRLCIAMGADGLRGELTLMRASRAAAALAGDRRGGPPAYQTRCGDGLAPPPAP